MTLSPTPLTQAEADAIFESAQADVMSPEEEAEWKILDQQRASRQSQ